VRDIERLSVCACVRERETRVPPIVPVRCACVYVCERVTEKAHARETELERDRDRDRERERKRVMIPLQFL